MNKQESKKLYEGKHFYEIVKPKGGGIQLFGPFDNIYYSPNISTGEPGFVQLIDGKPVVYFSANEILVTDRIL